MTHPTEQERDPVKLPEPMGYVCRGDFVRCDLAKETHRESWSPAFSMTDVIAYGEACARDALIGHEKMRGGKPVTFWRDDALEAAAGIVEAYQADSQIAKDIRAMKGQAK